MIEVARLNETFPLELSVRVADGAGETIHTVSLSRETYERLTQGVQPPERCVEAAFRFLLDREPKEAILRRFDIEVIATYFPEFEQALPNYL